MNSLKFFVDINDNVVRCVYQENIDKNITEIITLPNTILHDIFFRFIKAFPDVVPTINGSLNIFTFYDINDLLIEKLINDSEEYKRKMSSGQNKLMVKRVNKFKKEFVRASATILAALTLFTISKKCIDELNIDFPPTLSFSAEFVEKINDFDLEKFLSKKKIYNNVEQTHSPTFVEHTMETPTMDIKEIPNVQIEIKDEELITPDSFIRLGAENCVNDEKYNITKSYYLESLSKIAEQYGIDPALALAVCTHERGLHSNEVDPGGGMGLFQIQVEGSYNWINEDITAYNFETEQYETVTITKDLVSDVFKNMQIGCMILQNYLSTYDYNILEAVTAYNYGPGNLKSVLDTCSNETGIPLSELNNINNTEWLKYRKIISGGDPEYLENVFKYIENGTILSFIKPNHETLNLKFDNINYTVDKSL